ncbi:MAG: hypothetical protein ABIC95_02260 [archaeon]
MVAYHLKKRAEGDKWNMTQTAAILDELDMLADERTSIWNITQKKAVDMREGYRNWQLVHNYNKDFHYVMSIFELANQIPWEDTQMPQFKAPEKLDMRTVRPQNDLKIHPLLVPYLPLL